MKKRLFFCTMAVIFIGCILTTNSSFAEKNGDLLYQKKVTYSGIEGGKIGDAWKYPQFVGENVVDGNDQTRWSADKLDKQWLIVDLGEERELNEIILDFYVDSPQYEVLVSVDNKNYQVIYKEDKGQGGKKVKKSIAVANQKIRYIKYQQLKMWRHNNGKYYGSSLIAIEAYEKSALPKGIKIQPASIKISEQASQILSWQVIPADVKIADTQIEWRTSDSNVVTVDKRGEITAVKSGNAKVTVKIQDTDYSATIPVVVTKEHPQYKAMRSKWKEGLLGSQEYQNDPDIRRYGQKIASESEEVWKNLNQEPNRTYLWRKKASDTRSADYTTQFINIKKLTLGYYNPSSQIFKNETVFMEIIRAIEFMIDQKKYNGTYWTGNWWDWQIGSAQALTDTLILLRDDLSKRDTDKLVKFVRPLKLYAKNPKVQWPNYPATGANLTDISLIVLGTAILLEEDDRVTMVQQSVPLVLKKVTKGDGLYQDGSLIQHGYFPYNGSYGNVLLKGFGKIQTILKDTDWEITDKNITNLYTVIDKGYLQLMVDGKMLSMVSGRSISRAPGTNPFTSEFESGKETIANLTLLAKLAPENLKSKIYSAVKTWLNKSHYYYNYFENPRDFEALIDLKKIINDDSIPLEETDSMNVYPSMDRVLQKNSNYAIGISMYSNRIGNYEFGNTENKKGWHTADGMVYLYNGDLAQFDEGYWATVDPYRLPGTTVDTRVLTDGAFTGRKSPQSWVGGASDGSVAAIGMFLDKTNEGMNLTAKKTWFLLDGKLINLGSGITGETKNSIETIVENRMIDSKKVTVVKKSMKDNFWVNLTTPITANNLGYIFPNAMKKVDVVLETRSGKYADVNEYFINDKQYTKDFVKIIKNHGKVVQNETYEYLTLVGKTNEEMSAISTDKGYRVLANTSTLQAVTTDRYLMANVWQGNQKLDSMQINQSMSIIREKISDQIYRFTLANPKQDNKKVSFVFNKKIAKIIEKSPNISVNKNVITLDSVNLAGSSQAITLKISSN